MRRRRFLVPHLAGEPQVEIRGPQAHHLLHVLRLRPGDEVVLFDGKGHQIRAVLARCERSYAVARKLGPLPLQESPLAVTLAVAVPRTDRMPLIVRMLTELGTSRLIPLVTERTLVKSPRALKSKRLRWSRIAAEACKQSGRSRSLAVEEPFILRELLATELPPERILACPGGTALPGSPRSSSCLALVGPEGGWTKAEVALSEAHGFRPLGLGPRTLRVETAAAATATILQWSWGDLNPSGPVDGTG